MSKHDIESSLVWMGLGILFIIGSLKQGLFRRGIPGPGFLPFIVAIILVGLSLMIFIPALIKKVEVQTTKEITYLEKHTFKRISLAIFALFAYAISLKNMGYVLTTFLFMLFMPRILESIGWVKIFFLALLTAIFSYYLFFELEVQLPQGIFGM